MAILILYAKVRLLDGSLATGPVTTQNYEEFLFKNTGSDLDLYFCLKKNGSAWHSSNGPTTVSIPQSFIDQVGQQIDQELVIK